MESLHCTRSVPHRGGRPQTLPIYENYSGISTRHPIAPFLWGFVIYLLGGLLFDWTSGSDLWWSASATGLLTALLFLVNGLISDGVTISWLEFPLRRLFVSAVLTVVTTLLVAAFNMALFTFLRYGQLPDQFFAGGSGYYWSVLLITVIISLFMHGRSFLLSYKEAIVAQEELKRAQLASRFESLRNQVNPHFLFNSLNVLSNLVYKDPDLSAKFIQQLSQVYRYVLESSDKEVVSLREEHEILKAYLFLLNIRFGEQIQVTFDLPYETTEQIAPLSLQMLVENAVKHNVVSKRYPLQLKIQRQGDRVMVWNSRKHKQQIPESLGIGLANIAERYRILSGEEVKVDESDTHFSVSLPILQM
jgi:sensor histidine kinase YesM